MVAVGTRAKTKCRTVLRNSEAVNIISLIEGIMENNEFHSQFCQYIMILFGILIAERSKQIDLTFKFCQISINHQKMFA